MCSAPLSSQSDIGVAGVDFPYVINDRSKSDVDSYNTGADLPKCGAMYPLLRPSLQSSLHILEVDVAHTRLYGEILHHVAASAEPANSRATPIALVV